jgi:broad specificity phosphatase PhoE
MPAGSAPELILLRHGAVASHRGDVALTAAGREQAHEAGRRLAADHRGPIRVLCGATRRAQETAQLLADALGSGDPARRVVGPDVAFALRNPDLYLGGARVDMVSSAAAFAEQAPGLTEDDVLSVPFFAGFLAAADRIGWWLQHDSPPGDDAAAVTTRIASFARSLGDGATAVAQTVVGITHSPVLRAVATRLLGSDPGEPPYLHGYALGTGEMAARLFSPWD